MVGVVDENPVAGLAVDHFTASTTDGGFVSQDNRVEVAGIDMFTRIVLQKTGEK